MTVGVDETATAGIPLPSGLSVRVRVPASSANLGPGFDCLGIALGIYDEVVVETAESDVVVDVQGEGAADVPRDGTHLVARCLARGLAHAGYYAAGLKLRCVNVIPHSRGLGSSAAAAVSGFAAASGLLAAAGVGTGLSQDELVQLSSEVEGHPDNAAASVLGSAVVTWTDHESGQDFFRARRLSVHPDITATVFIPDTESSTAYTRGLLPADVPRTDAIFNVSRSALAVVALTSDPSSLLAATEDRLHQSYRAPAMPQTAELVSALRARGFAATVSGAGPTVLVLSVRPVPAEIRDLAVAAGFVPRTVAVAGGVEITTS
ncbi:homoserine kinase [Gordonia sp. ABSL1-1]|uniref:homoserine kinase n=1 Tax=Gordonia sp. ABSL1-1 TaxID=3053923 RepID=UPI00257232A7|nr:homoserine kinase [Gordonia sp. ABSL1-1]MDL9937041.1 homoserine kinase [Gordonia sp. ABSL1-1]